jgi:predicted transcriptional regulator
MKSFKVLLTVLFAITLCLSTFARTVDPVVVTMNQPTVKTETFKVLGKCGMCKTRVEKTAKTEGATSAAWDSKTQMLTVTFDPSKTNKDALSKKIASVGHDTELYKAPDDVYENLPGCCHYERLK